MHVIRSTIELLRRLKIRNNIRPFVPGKIAEVAFTQLQICGRLYISGVRLRGSTVAIVLCFDLGTCVDQADQVDHVDHVDQYPAPLNPLDMEWFKKLER